MVVSFFWQGVLDTCGLLRCLSGKESICSAVSIPGLGRSSGGGNGNPLQYSYLKNPMDRGAWWATVHGVTKVLDTAEHARTAQVMQALT